MHNLDLGPLRAYPYYPGKYGIDFGQVEESGMSLQGGSGRKLFVVFGNDNLRVNDVSGFDAGGDAIMGARVFRNTIIFSLFTRSFTTKNRELGPRHPDFLVFQFAHCALNFFTSNYKTPITSMLSSPGSSSLNYRQYWEARIGGASKVEAAKSTWSALLAKDLGFNGEPIVDDEVGLKVIVDWPK